MATAADVIDAPQTGAIVSTTANVSDDRTPHMTLTISEETAPEQPKSSWTDAQLLSAAAHNLAIREQANAIAEQIGRRGAMAFYDAGHALSLLRDRIKPRENWTDWQKSHGLNRDTVNRAIRLYDSAKGKRKQLEKLTVKAALLAFVPADPARKKVKSTVVESTSGSEEEESKQPEAGGTTRNTSAVSPVALRETVNLVNQITATLNSLESDPARINTDDLDTLDGLLRDRLEQIAKLRKAASK